MIHMLHSSNNSEWLMFLESTLLCANTIFCEIFLTFCPSIAKKKVPVVLVRCFSTMFAFTLFPGFWSFWHCGTGSDAR